MSQHVTIGTRFRTPYADSNALWEVREDVGNGVWDATIVEDEDYGGHSSVFRTDAIERALGMSDLFARLGNESADWWDSRLPGEVVHYHNGFENYVRGIIEIAEDGRPHMRPIALVGAWRSHDLPRRMPNGSIRATGTYARILMGEKVEPFKVLRPNPSNMYGGPRFTRDGENPALMDEINLTPPPMTPAEEADAVDFQTWERARAALGGDGYPRTAEEARDRLAAVTLVC